MRLRRQARAVGCGRSVGHGQRTVLQASAGPRPVLFGGMSATTTLQRWICESCGYIYDREEGDPDGGIPPGTTFTDIPDTWFCPVCGARKRDFVPYEE